MTDTVETAVYRLRVEGQDQLGQLKSNLDGVTVSEEKAQAATRATTAALERRIANLDPVIRAQERYRKELEAATRFAQAGVGTDAQRTAQIELATQRYNSTVQAIAKVEQATQRLGTTTGLARHEVINLSRQMQDVVVSLQGGQGIGTVFLQQGSQILDVLGTSQGGIRGGLASLAGSLRNVLSVGRLAFGGIAAAVGTAAFALSDYLDKQRDIERGLIGAGRRSGATVADINQIGRAGASSTGFSVSEAREVALEFAKTGQVHKSVIGEMIETTKNFAIITGQSGKEAAESLAKAFSDMQGIDALNKQFLFLDGTTRRTIETMLLFGRTTEAAALASQKLNEVIGGAEGTLSASEKGWRALTNAISGGWTAIGEFLARAANLEKLNLGDRIKQVQEQISQTQSAGPGLLGTAAQEEKLERLREILAKLTAEAQKFDNTANFNKLSVSAQQAISAIDPLRGKLDQVVATLSQLRDLQAQQGNIPGLQMALTYYTQIAEQIQRQMQAQDALLAKYPGMTAEFAKQVDALKDQNRLLEARQNGDEASVAAAIAYKNAIAAGANETEAAAIKAETLKGNLLQAAQAASQMGSAIEVAAIQAGSGADFTDGGSGGSGKTDADDTFGGKQYGGFTSDIEMFYRGLANRLPDAQSIINGALRGGVSSALSSLKKTQFQSEIPTKGLPFDINSIRPGFGSQGDITSAVSQLYDLKLAQAGDDKAAKEAIYADQLAWLQQQPGTIQNLQAQVAIQQAMKNLTDAVDANTDAQNASLNPLYSEGRSALKIGYYKAATGLEGIVGGSGGVDSTPVHMMLTPGEHVKVTPQGQPSNDNSKTVNFNITNNFGGSKSKNRRSDRQFAQGLGDMAAALG